MAIEGEWTPYLEWANPLIELSHRIAISGSKSVIVSGSGSQNMGYGIKMVWQMDPSLKKFPIPRFFSLGRIERSTGYSDTAEISSLIRDRMGRHLSDASKSPVYVIDECLHSGDTLSVVSNALQGLGFKNIKHGVLVGTNSGLHDMRDLRVMHPNGVIKIDYVSRVEGSCPVFRQRRTIFSHALRARANFYRKTKSGIQIVSPESFDNAIRMALMGITPKMEYQIARSDTLNNARNHRLGIKSAVEQALAFKKRNKPK